MVLVQLWKPEISENHHYKIISCFICQSIHNAFLKRKKKRFFFILKHLNIIFLLYQYIYIILRNTRYLHPRTFFRVNIKYYRASIFNCSEKDISLFLFGYIRRSVREIFIFWVFVTLNNRFFVIIFFNVYINNWYWCDTVYKKRDTYVS